MNLTIPLVALNRLSSDIQAVLLEHNLIKDAVRISHCYGYHQCQSIYCVLCASRRAYKERQHATEAIKELLGKDSRYQLWFITGAAADSPDIRASARSAVVGMSRMLRNHRLKGRVIAHFSALQVERKQWRKYPCAHVHTLAITKPLRGRSYISQKLWIAMWEQACSHHRKPLPERRLHRKGAKLPQHPSLLARLVPRRDIDLIRVVSYCTRWATAKHASIDYGRLLSPNPRDFLERMAALKGIPKFFGSLHRRKVRRQHPGKAASSKKALAIRRHSTGRRERIKCARSNP